jgi:hypothetical protein
MTRRYTRDDRAESIYQYLVVDVPPEAGGLAVTLWYDRSDAIIDLGLIGPDRFCGWSGSERADVVVTRDWATPGYLPGAVAGPWQIILGLHRVGPGGVDVHLDVATPREPPQRPPPPPPRLCDAHRGAASRRRPDTSGWPVTSTATPSTRTAPSTSSSWRCSPPSAGSTSSP